MAAELTGGDWTAIAAAAFGLATVAVNLISVGLAGFRLRRRPDPSVTRAAPDPAPAVSIVRPVCGVESFSEETLRSGFGLAYPVYELVFGVAQASDPVVPLVRRLMAEHPGVPARLIVGDERVSDNPKLNNCVRGWDAARHDWVILADSNVVMPADYIQSAMAAWRPDSGLVCSPPLGSRPASFWAEVECAFLNTFQARWQFAGEQAGFGFAQGKTMLWHKPFLEAHGGIRALGAEIAEDAASTKIVRRAGLHVHLVDAPYEQPLGRRRPAEVWARQLRWARLRRVTFPAFFLPEAFSTPVLPALALTLAAAQAGISVPGTLLAVALAWYGPELVLIRRQRWHLSWRMPLACLIRDAMILPMFVGAWVTSDLVWRGNAMHIDTRKTAGSPTA